MHELGHNLNLDHGGLHSSFLPYNVGSTNYNMNCKPNYLSVMIYSRQVPIDPLTVPIWEGTSTSNSFLNYSSHGYWSPPGWPISDLTEGSLSELSGLTTQDRQTIVYGTPDRPIQLIRISPTHLASDSFNSGINWNGNSGIDSGFVSEDINQLDSTGCPVVLAR